MSGLILDLVRRLRRGQTIYLFVMVAGVWWMCAWIGPDAASTSMAFGISMSAAFGFGTYIRFVPRPIWYLPVSQRDVFRAHWLVHTLGAVFLTTAAKLLVFLVPSVRQAFGLGGLALSAVFDLAYAGIGHGLFALSSMPQPGGGPWRRPAAVVKRIADSVWPLGTAGAMAMAGLIPGTDRHFLPTHWSDLTGRSLAVLGAALAVTVAGYFSSSYTVPPAASKPAGAPRAVKRAPARDDRVGLGGLPRLLVHECGWTLMTGGALVAVSMLVAFVASRLAQAPEGFAGFVRSLLLRVDGQLPSGAGDGLDGFIVLFVVACLAASLAARFPAMLRHLRVLPLGTAQLNAVLTAWPAVIWLGAWTILLAVHYVMLGEGVASYHVGALLALIGVNAIVRAVLLRYSGYLSLLVIPMLMGIAVLLFLTGAPPPTALVAIGAGGLAAAAMLNHSALARRSAYTAAAEPGIGSTPLF